MSTSIRPRHATTAAQSHPGTLRAARVSMVILLLFVGLGGVFGGVEMLRRPLDPMGMTPELISGSPFDTYTWPGILLLVLVGLVPSVLALGLVIRRTGAMLFSGLFGVGLMAWIGVQWALLSDRLWLQPAMFTVGAAIAALATFAWRRGGR